MNKSLKLYIHRSLVVAFVSTLLFACSSPKTAEKAPEEEKKNTGIVSLTAQQIQHADLKFGSFDQTVMAEEVSATGTVEVPPQQLISVSVPISGFVKSISLLPGSAIRKGQVLAVIQSLEYVQLQQEYLQAMSKQKFQEQDLSRQETLNQEKVGSSKKLQQVDADFQNTQALLKGLEVKLRLIGCSIPNLKKGVITPSIQLHSPISGFVKTVNINVGKNVVATDVLMDLVSTEHLHLDMRVFEKDASSVKEGQTLVLETPKLSESKVTGRVVLVGKTIEGEAKTIIVHVHLNSEELEKHLIVGQYVNGKIQTAKKLVNTLPEGAILRRSEGSFIFVKLSETTFQQIPVKLGNTDNGNVVVYPEISIDDKPIVRNGASILQAVLSGGEE